jgi:hypothetical protein
MKKYNCGNYCLARHFGIPGEAESLPQEPPVNNESPFETGDCLYGVPNCKGHEMIDGKIEIPNHPPGHVIIYKGSQT